MNFFRGPITWFLILFYQLSNLPNELSIQNFLKQFKTEYPDKDIATVDKNIASITKSFKETLPVSLRNKVCAHVDQEFKHSDFTSAYILPDLVEKYFAIVSDLKEVFFVFANFERDGEPHRRILEQSRSIIENTSVYAFKAS